MTHTTTNTDCSYDTQRAGKPGSLALRSILPGETAAYVLDRGRMLLGRAEGCEIRLEKSRVSRRHAELDRQGPVLALRDLGSTNGTYLDGSRVEHACVLPGSILRIGGWLGRFETETARMPAIARELEPGLVGGGEIAGLLRELDLAASANLPIVLVGETGTGKELFARAAHAYSGRNGPFHAINCAALPAQLAEAELFGHAAGAFTGGERARSGHLMAAHGGTLFLDETLDLPLAVQAKLLRALERKELAPLGETRPVPFDAQLVVACQRPLAAAVEAGTFRADLAARLSGATVTLPPLRERLGDVPTLFHEFLQLHAGDDPCVVSTKAYECLCLYDWPGNVRELEMLARNVASRLDGETTIHRRHLPTWLRQRVPSEERPTNAPLSSTRRDYDAERLAQALVQVAGNVSAAARNIGISRQRAYRLLKARDGGDA